MLSYEIKRVPENEIGRGRGFHWVLYKITTGSDRQL